MKIFPIILFLILTVSCEKVHYYPDKPIVGLKAAMAHRGGRTNVLRENCLSTCIEALKTEDGVEIDIQISKDRTIWLTHGLKVENCSGELNYFPETKDSTIENIDSCNGKPIGYTKFEELISYTAVNCPNKNINVDLKGWFPCSGSSLDILSMMRLEIEQIIKIGIKYNYLDHLQIETGAVSVLNWGKKISSKVNTYLNVYGDLERGILIALQNKLSGISYKLHIGDELTPDYVHLCHKKGLRVITWNVVDDLELKALQNIGVDFTEYDIN